MLHYDLDFGDVLRLADEFQATEKQVKFSIARAMRRTEATLRRMSSQGLAKELQLRSAKALRNRLKSIRIRMKGQELGLWYGLNPLPVSAFKGRPKETAGGASFRGENYQGAFVGRSKVKGKQTIFKRVRESSLPIAEQLHPIEDKAVTYIEDQIFDQVLDIFWKNFTRDLAARVKFKLGES